MKKISFLIATWLLMTYNSYAQNEIEMATGLRSDGKIYVVILVMLVIFLGLAVFLFMLDRRVSKLEKSRSVPNSGIVEKFFR